jgi:hypothetical protein
MKKNTKLDENYFLVSQEVNPNTTVEVVKNINHLIIVDVSGSMSYDLPEIRKNLKNKISSLVKENDTVSIIWFSGRNDAGILKEEVQVNSLKQLNDLNDAIDRFLKPIGLTAFAKPLELANDIIGRINKNNPNGVFSLIFMSDGYNNDTSWENVMNAVKQISPKLSSSVVVEYGWYADSRRLTEIAGALGGEKISCSGFEEYDVVIGKSFGKTLSDGKKVVVNITDKYLYDFAFSVGKDGSVLLYNIQDDKIIVGSDVKEIYFFSPNAVGTADAPLLNNIVPQEQVAKLYAAIYILADKLLPEIAEKVFYALGDNFYYKMLAGAFGKQKLNSFKAAIKECVANASKRFPNGIGTIQKVDDNAYCLMNLIEDLGNTEGCLFYKGHPDFQYNKIGVKRVTRGENLSEADKKRLSEAKNLEEVNKITEELKEKNVAVKFVDSDPNRGYPLTDLVWNEKRANLSVRVYIEGEAIIPENKYKIEKVASFRYKTYTLIKDGIVNVQKLPVSFTPELDQLLVRHNIKTNFDVDKKIIVIDLTSLPIINRVMVKSISAKGLAVQEWELQKLQADKKVYDYFRKSLFPKESKSFVELLGQEQADWLKTIGITDYNGFSPLTDAEESTDFYMSVNLETKIKGFSSLPKVEDVIAKLKSGTALKPNEGIMADAVKKYQAQLESDIYKSLSEEQQKGVLKTYLETKSDILNKKRRKALQEIAQIKFALILSKKWFTEFKTFDENKLSLKLDGQDLDFTFDLSEKEEKI